METKDVRTVVGTSELEVHKLDVGRKFLLKKAELLKRSNLLRDKEEGNNRMRIEKIKGLVDLGASSGITNQSPKTNITHIILSQSLTDTISIIIDGSTSQHDFNSTLSSRSNTMSTLLKEGETSLLILNVRALSRGIVVTTHTRGSILNESSLLHLKTVVIGKDDLVVLDLGVVSHDNLTTTISRTQIEDKFNDVLKNGTVLVKTSSDRITISELGLNLLQEIALQRLDEGLVTQFNRIRIIISRLEGISTRARTRSILIHLTIDLHHSVVLFLQGHSLQNTLLELEDVLAVLNHRLCIILGNKRSLLGKLDVSNRVTHRRNSRSEVEGVSTIVSVVRVLRELINLHRNLVVLSIHNLHIGSRNDQTDGLLSVPTEIVEENDTHGVVLVEVSPGNGDVSVDVLSTREGLQKRGRGLSIEEETVSHLDVVVIGNSLLLSTSNSIVVLELTVSLLEAENLLVKFLLLNVHLLSISVGEENIRSSDLIAALTVHTLQSLSGGVVTSPVSTSTISVRHKVLLIEAPLALIFVDGLDVVREDRVLDTNTELLTIGIDVVNELIHVLVSNESVVVSEITTPSNDEVIAIIVPLNTALDHIHKAASLLLHVDLEGGEFGIPLEPLVISSPVEVLTSRVGEEITFGRRAVVGVHDVGEDVALGTEGLGASPDELEVLVLLTVVLVLVVNTVDTEGIETDIGEELSETGGVAEGVDVPADGGADAELVVDELGTEGHLGNDIFVVGSSLIVHGPATEVELELAVLDELTDLVLDVVILLIPPSLEEGLLNIGELSGGVGLEGSDNGVENVSDLLERIGRFEGGRTLT